MSARALYRRSCAGALSATDGIYLAEDTVPLSSRGGLDRFKGFAAGVAVQIALRLVRADIGDTDADFHLCAGDCRLCGDKTDIVPADTCLVRELPTLPGLVIADWPGELRVEVEAGLFVEIHRRRDCAGNPLAARRAP